MVVREDAVDGHDASETIAPLFDGRVPTHLRYRTDDACGVMFLERAAG